MEKSLSVNDFKVELQKNYMNSFKNYFKTEKEVMKFLSSVSYMVEKTPKLLEVNKQSLFESVIQSAQLGFMPWITWEVYILPFKGRAQLQIGYQWYVSLLYKAWISAIYSEIVKENDKFKLVWWLEPTIIHELDPWDRWEAKWVYVVAKINWEKVWKYMSKEDVLKFKWFSQSKDSKYSPWLEKNDPELNMWRKTCLKQLQKLLPKNELIAKAEEIDNNDWDIKEFVKWQIEVESKSKAEKLKEKYSNSLPDNQETNENI